MIHTSLKATFLKLFVLVTGWRIALVVIGAGASFFFNYQPSFPYAYTLLPSYGLPQWIYSWANFDGVHYLTIVQKGYVGTGLIQAFFPGYPLLVFLVNALIAHPLISGLFVSNLFLSISVMLWWLLLKKEGSSNQASWIGIFTLLLFPTFFFMGALYSESLFLTLIFASFLAARNQKWWLAGILAGFASGTRVVGVLLVPALIIEYCLHMSERLDLKWQASSWLTNGVALVKLLKKSDYVKLLGLVVFGSTGLVAYMAYLAGEFNDPLYFLHVQSEFGAGRSETFILYPQVVWRYLKILGTYQTWDWRYFAYFQEFVIGVGGFLALLASFKYVRFSYAFFSLAVFLVPTLTGTFSSMPRYMLASFAFFLLLSRVLHSRRWLTLIYLLGSLVLLIINTMLFIQGYWVA
ncbi:MAG TPA: hypothetical protein VF209_03500 [Patescibacteria group bacterium]